MLGIIIWAILIIFIAEAAWPRIDMGYPRLFSRIWSIVCLGNDLGRQNKIPKKVKTYCCMEKVF